MAESSVKNLVINTLTCLIDSSVIPDGNGITEVAYTSLGFISELSEHKYETCPKLWFDEW